jgi:uncharacterized repeat protein (TIGR01451 family)
VAVTATGACTTTTYYFQPTPVDLGAPLNTQYVASTTALGTTEATLAAISNGSANIVDVASFYLEPPAASQVDFGVGGSVSTTFWFSKAGANAVVVGYVYKVTAAGVETLLGQSAATPFNGNTTPSTLTFSVPVSGQSLPAGSRLRWRYTVASSHASNPTTVTAYFGTSTRSPVSSTSFCTTAPANPTIDKQVDKLLATPGDALAYTIRFANSGQSNMMSSQIVDTLPAGVTFTSATMNGSAITPAISGQQLTFAVQSSDAVAAGQVTGGQSGTLVIDAAVSSPFTGAGTTLTNSVSFTSAQTTAITDSIVTTLQRPSVTISKSADDTSLAPGGTVTYALDVLNAGPGTASNVTHCRSRPTSPASPTAPASTVSSSIRTP